jgi:hypothetical protein
MIALIFLALLYQKGITELQALNYLKVIILRLFDYFYLINKLYKNFN